jgi:hypothetical protein
VPESNTSSQYVAGGGDADANFICTYPVWKMYVGIVPFATVLHPEAAASPRGDGTVVIFKLSAMNVIRWIDSACETVMHDIRNHVFRPVS